MLYTPKDLKAHLKFFLRQADCIIADTDNVKHLKTSFTATHASSQEMTQLWRRIQTEHSDHSGHAVTDISFLKYSFGEFLIVSSSEIYSISV